MVHRLKEWFWVLGFRFWENKRGMRDEGGNNYCPSWDEWV